MAQAWEQQIGESSAAYSAFMVYVMLGAHHRSLDLAAEKVGKGARQMQKWSKGFAWVERAGAWDRHVMALEREMQEVQIRQRAVEWGKRQQELKEAEWEVATGMIERLKEWLRLPLTKMNARDAAYMLDIASKVARLASGMATEHAEHTGEGGGPIKIDLGPMLRKVYGNIIDVPGGGAVAANLLEGGSATGMRSGTDGQLCAGGDHPAAAAIDGERGSASV